MKWHAHRSLEFVNFWEYRPWMEKAY